MNSPSTSPDELASIRQELNELRQALGAMRSNGNGHYNKNGSSLLEAAESTALTDRRGMLKKVGAIAAGIATVGLLRPTTARAANGDPLTFGVVTGSETSPAEFFYNGSATNSALFVFQDGNTLSPSSGNSSAVLAGWASGGPAGSTVGVHGRSSTGSGVVAQGLTGASGLTASSDTGNAVSVSDFAGTTQYAADLQGGLALLCLSPSARYQGTPYGDNLFHEFGEVFMQTSGDDSSALWWSTVAGTPGKWRKLAGNLSAGATHILATPVRYVDTRNGTGGTTGPVHNGTVIEYNFVTINAGTIPAKATGIFGNIVATAPGGNGNFQVNTINSFPPGSASVMNFITGVNLANHFVAALDANGNLFIKANVFTGSGNVQIVIDIYGYYI